MFAVNDPRRVPRKIVTYSSLAEALEAINQDGPTEVVDMDGSLRGSFRGRKRITFDGDWVCCGRYQYGSLRSLIQTIPKGTFLTRLHVTFNHADDRPIKLRLTKTIPVHRLYG